MSENWLIHAHQRQLSPELGLLSKHACGHSQAEHR